VQKVKPVVVFVAVVVLLSSFFAPKKKDLWQDWATIQQLAQKEKKPLLIDIYTDWCIYCKKMDAKTYKNDSVYSFLKENFYRLKFNAEMKEDFVWNGTTFSYNPRYKTNEFAYHITKGMLTLPTTVIVPVEGEPFFIPGELETGEMEALLKYFTAGIYRSQPYEEYIKAFKASWK